MAEDIKRERAQGWGDVVSPLAARLVTREAAIALALAILTFAVYWFLGPKDTVYSFQVSQANNIIHGHLDLRP